MPRARNTRRAPPVAYSSSDDDDEEYDYDDYDEDEDNSAQECEEYEYREPAMIVWCHHVKSGHGKVTLERPTMLRSVVVTTNNNNSKNTSLNLNEESDAQNSLADVDTPKAWLVLAQFTPAEDCTSADGIYLDTPPVVLGACNVNEHISLKYEMRYKGVLRVWLQPNNNSNNSDESEALCVFENAKRYKELTVTLSGAMETDQSKYDMEDEEGEGDVCWRPIIAMKWLKWNDENGGLDMDEDSAFMGSSHKRKRSQKSRSAVATSHSHASVKQDRETLAKEAVAVSSGGDVVLFKDGTTEAMSELAPFARFYTPASAERKARVRRFPHRNADVVGELSYGRASAAIGEEIDPFTGERYVLLLAVDPLSHLSPTEQSAFSGATLYRGVQMWGWSKVRGSGGTDFLTEVPKETYDSQNLPETDASSGGNHSNHHNNGEYRTTEKKFDQPTMFVSARQEKGVRIRSSPSLHAPPLGMLEQNEVKVAVSIHRISHSQHENDANVKDEDGEIGEGEGAEVGEWFNEFVEWMDGGYSLARSHRQVFLEEVYAEE